MHNNQGFLSYNLTNDKTISLCTKLMCVMSVIVTNLHKVRYKHQCEESTLASALLKKILIQDFSCMFFPRMHFISMTECFETINISCEDSNLLGCGTVSLD